MNSSLSPFFKPKNLLPFKTGALHFIGIGGIGMSGMAEILHNLGYDVQGSSDKANERTKSLQKMGIKVTIGHSEDNIKNDQSALPSLVIISAAIPSTNPELVIARQNNIPVVSRAAMLNQIMSLKWSVGVAGTHGKTTTTTMVTAMLSAGGIDPTVINGGIIHTYKSNAHLGNGDWIVAEACEAYGSILDIHPTVGIVTNIDADHLNFYKDLDDIKDVFRGYLQRLPFYGFGVVCLDDAGVKDIIHRITDRRIYTYGFDANAHAKLSNVTPQDNGTHFDIEMQDPYQQKPSQTLKDLRIDTFGRHNILNAAAAITIAWQFGLDEDQIRQGLLNFESPDRRFSIRGKPQDITIIDNFSNHPNEIKATLSGTRDYLEATANEKYPSGKRKIHAVYETTAMSLNDHIDLFVDCFDAADEVYLTPITQKHKLRDDHHPEDLITKMNQAGHNNVILLENFNAIFDQLEQKVKPGDIVIGIGIYDMVNIMKQMPNHVAAFSL